MGDRPFSRPLRILDADSAAGGGDGASIADLAPRLRIKRCALEKDLDLVAFACGIRCFPFFADANELGLGHEHAVASELGLRDIAGECPLVRDVASRALALQLHLRAKAFFVNLHAAFGGELARQLERKSKRVVKAERIGP